MSEDIRTNRLQGSLRRWKLATLTSWAAFVLLAALGGTLLFQLEQETAQLLQENEKQRQIAEVARREAEKSLTAEKKLAELKEKHDQMLYAHRIMQAHREWEQAEQKKPAKK